MASRNERAGAIRSLAGRTGDLGVHVLTELDRLRFTLDQSEFDAEDLAAYWPEFEDAAGALARVVSENFEVQRARLIALAEALEGAGLAGVAVPTVGSGRHATVNAAGPVLPAAVPATSGRFTGEIIPHRGHNFEVWSFAGVDPTTLDWGVDPNFPQHFEADVWKGHPASDYRNLTAQAPALLSSCRASGPGEIQGDLGFVRDAYFGSEPVRLSVTTEGKIHITGGRHRLMAAIEVGASIPVSVTRQGSDGWSET